MTDKKSSVIDDLKSSKGLIMGVIALASGIATVLVTYFNFEPTSTWLVTLGIILGFLFIGYLMEKSEQRQITAMEAHEKWSQEIITGFRNDIKNLLSISRENQKAAIRGEMNLCIYNTPENHDTILRYAQKYFIGLDGDWVETDIFMNWVENEAKAGRPVRVPIQLSTTLTAKVAEEKTNEK